jgi:PAS domain S-box-containing protein
VAAAASVVPEQPTAELYRLLVERAADVMWTADLSLRLTYASPSAGRLHGYSLTETVGRSLLDILTPDSRTAVTRALESALSREQLGFRDPSWPETLELEALRKDGSTVWIEVNVAIVRDGEGRPVGVVGVTRDIGRRKVAQAALKESERRYRLLAENVTDVISTSDLALRLTYVSPSVARLLGYSVEEVMALSVRESMTAPSFEVAAGALAEGLEQGASDPLWSRTIELELLRKDGSTVWVEISVKFLRDEQGRPAGLLAVTRDITARRQVEEMKADFIALTTHQLRTPLAGIKWLLEFAAGDASVSDETRSYIRDATESADRLIEIVNNLLDSAGLENGMLNVEREATHVGKLTRSVLDEFEPAIRDRDLAVSVTGAESVGTLTADPQLLRQAVLNLISNAVKYTPPSGRIAIRMRRDARGIQWEIEDSGIGIPEAARPRMFQKFFRAANASAIAPEGTGLGLYLARLVIERFGGRLEYESDEGHGAIFRFALPAGD